MSTFLSDTPVLASDLRKLDTRLTGATGVQVDNAVAALVDSAPAALDTLNELAQALYNIQKPFPIFLFTKKPRVLFLK